MAIDKTANIRINTQVMGQDALNNLTGAFTRLESGVFSFGKSMAGAVFGGNLLMQATEKLVGFVSDGVKEYAEFNKVSQTFKGNLELLQNATKGLVDETELMVSANKLQTMGIKLSTEQQESAYESVTKLARAMNLDMNTALNALTDGLGRQQPRILKQLGILFDVKSAQEKYADSIGKTVKELTDEEKQIAFTNGVIEQMKGKADTLGVSFNTVSDRLTRAKLAMGDFGKEVGGFLTETLKYNLEFYDFLDDGYRKFVKKLADSYNWYTTMIGKADESLGLTQENVQKKLSQVPSRDKEGKFAFVDPDTGNLTVMTSEQEAIQLQKEREYYKKQEQLAKDFQNDINKWSGGVNPESQLQWQRKSNKDYEDWKNRDKSKPGTGSKRKKEGPPSIEDILGGEEGGTDFNERMKEAEAKFKLQDKLQKAYDDKLEAVSKDNNAQRESIKLLEKQKAANMKLAESFQHVVINGLQPFARGLWDAVDAAVNGGDSFGIAMQKIVKSTAMGIASTCTMEAVKETAYGLSDLAFFNGVGAAGHFASAAKFAAGAVLAGGIGLSMGNPGSSSGGRQSASGRPGANERGGPSFGEKKKAEDRQIIVNVTFDRADMAAESFAKRQVRAALQAA